MSFHTTYTYSTQQPHSCYVKNHLFRTLNPHSFCVRVVKGSPFLFWVKLHRQYSSTINSSTVASWLSHWPNSMIYVESPLYSSQGSFKLNPWYPSHDWFKSNSWHLSHSHSKRIPDAQWMKRLNHFLAHTPRNIYGLHAPLWPRPYMLAFVEQEPWCINNKVYCQFSIE